jgi:hypothetical protein
MYTKLFVIEQEGGTERIFWTCSAEHGSGWTPGHPKQSFSPSELTAQLRSMIDHGWFCTVIIRELKIPEKPEEKLR